MKKLQLDTSGNKCYLYIGVCILLMLLSLYADASVNKPSIKEKADTALNAAIKSGLVLYKNELRFPKSAACFYSNKNFTPVWIVAADKAKSTWQAMLMLDCVLQYGLHHADYHPSDVTYPQLQQIMEKPDVVSAAQKARYEIMLTDALLTFINYLHYGKLNPDYPAGRIDEQATTRFRAENVLLTALNGTDLAGVLTSVQPKSEQYILLQDQLRLATAQYTGDCYEIPESTIRKMAVNLERLRWLGDTEATYLQVNIPSYTLSFYRPDTVTQFKVIVGKPATPTPVLQSAITHFTTAPEWKVPQKIFVKELLPKALRDTTYLEANHFAIYTDKGIYVTPDKRNLASILRHTGSYYARQSGGCDNALGLVVFRFANAYDVYLHDTPQQQFFRKTDRALSHGCVRVQQAGKLAALLLKNDNAANKIPVMQKAMASYQNQTFTLRKGVPVKITYLTCEVKDALLTTYADVYYLDDALAQALYYTAPQLVLK